MRSTPLLITFLLVLPVGACGGEDEPDEPSALPADYKATYTEVRDCRLSIDHDLNYIRVLAAPDALAVYNTRTGTFPVGTLIVKEQFGEDDDSCAGEPTKYTLMQKLADSEQPDDLGWKWQELDANQRVNPEANIERCTSCHANCGVAPEGFDGTCAQP